MTWPPFFPDSCPPDESEPAAGIVFRLTATETPSEEDFKSHRELYPTRQYSVPECEACGLSVYRNIEDVRRAIAIVPALRSKKIAQGELRAEFGRIKHTPKNNQYGASHHTWWKPINQAPWSDFVVIPPEE